MYFNREEPPSGSVNKPLLLLLLLLLLRCKLTAYQFQEELLDLIRSYLCNRLNRVKLGATKSKWKRTERDCPQGSALGPLWNIFQNDLTYVIN